MKAKFKKSFILLSVIIIIFGFSVAHAGTQKLRMSSWIPSTHPVVSEALLPWAEDVEKVTEGRVKVQILKKSVGTPPQQFDLASKSVVDIVYGCHSYTPGRFFTHGFVELPMGGENAIATSIAYWRIYQKYMMGANEHKGVKLLSLFTHGPGMMFTSGTRINPKVNKNKALKIRGGGTPSTRVVDVLGATSIAAPISKAAEMISNGIVDGIMLDSGSLFIFKFDKYIKYRFVVNGGLYNVSFFMAANEYSWNKISAADRLAIEKISGEALARKAGKAWQRQNDLVEKLFKVNKIETDIPEGKLLELVKNHFEKFEKEWTDSVAELGIDGNEVINAYRQEVKLVTGELNKK